VDANPVGRRPAKYRFTAVTRRDSPSLTKPTRARSGSLKRRWPRGIPGFPANFVAETAATELPVIGAGLPAEASAKAANKTYYRVVALDEQGKRSGPSDYATAPRPVIYSKPVVSAKVGAEYRYQARAQTSPSETLAPA